MPRILTQNSIFGITLVGLVSLCGLLLTAGWNAKGYVNDIKADGAQMRAEIAALRAEVRKSVQDLTADRWSRTDHEHWVYQLQRLNTSLRVPEITSVGQQRQSPE